MPTDTYSLGLHDLMGQSLAERLNTQAKVLLRRYHKFEFFHCEDLEQTLGYILNNFPLYTLVSIGGVVAARSDLNTWVLSPRFVEAGDTVVAPQKVAVQQLIGIILDCLPTFPIRILFDEVTDVDQSSALQVRLEPVFTHTEGGRAPERIADRAELFNNVVGKFCSNLDRLFRQADRANFDTYLADLLRSFPVGWNLIVGGEKNYSETLVYVKRLHGSTYSLYRMGNISPESVEEIPQFGDFATINLSITSGDFYQLSERLWQLYEQGHYLSLDMGTKQQDRAPVGTVRIVKRLKATRAQGSLES